MRNIKFHIYLELFPLFVPSTDSSIKHLELSSASEGGCTCSSVDFCGCNSGVMDTSDRGVDAQERCTSVACC